MGYYIDQGYELSRVPTTWKLMQQNPFYSSYGYDDKTESIFANANIPLGFIEVEALWRLSVADLMREFSAFAMTVKALRVKAYSFVRPPATAIVNFNFYANGIFDSIRTTYPQGNWGLVEGYSPTPLDIAKDGVPLYPYVTIGVYHYLSANAYGFAEVLSAYPELLLDYETIEELYLVKFTSIFEEFPEPFTKITIEGTKHSRTTDGAGYCEMHLPAGSYTAIATKKDGDVSLAGRQSFVVPEDSMVTINMTEQFVLPWWWWIPVVAVGGVIVVTAWPRAREAAREIIIKVAK